MACERNAPSRSAISIYGATSIYSSCERLGVFLHDAELEVIAHLHRELDTDGFRASSSRASDVRRKNDVLEVMKDRLFKRLLMEDIKRSPSNLARFESFRESFFDDKLTTSAVHNADALLHDGERGGVDEPFGLRGEPDMKREVVGLFEYLVDGTSVTLFSRAMTGAINGS